MLQVSGVSSLPVASQGEALSAGPSPMPPLATLMLTHLAAARPRSDAEALKLLRQAFPAAPLAARVAAMAAARAVS